MTGHGKTYDQAKILNWITLFLAGRSQHETQYLGAGGSEVRPTDLKRLSSIELLAFERSEVSELLRARKDARLEGWLVLYR